MDQLQAMRIYLRVAEMGSFTRAATQLSLPKASVSTAIQQLENSLGARLLQRTTRQVRMTPDGQTYYQRCKDLLDEVEELQALFTSTPARLSGRLRVDLPIAIARHTVLPHLPDFLQQHPQLEIELSSTDRLVDLLSEGFDCVLRVGQLRDSNLIARHLGWQRQINCASPGYLAAHGTPHGLDDLAGHRLIHYQSVLGGRRSGFEYQDSSGSPRQYSMPGALTVNNSDAYHAACLAGMGIIQAPQAGVAAQLGAGQLVEILPDWQAAPLPVSLLYANRRQLPQRCRVFMQWLSELLQPSLHDRSGNAAVRVDADPL